MEGMQNIKTSETESDSNQHIHNPERRVCTVCTKQTSKYTCPKCATPYCSLECYRNHSSKCVDTFHKESVDDFLRHQRVTEAEKLKMHRILKRAEEQSTQEEETFDRMKTEPEEWTEEDEFFERLAETEMDLNELKLDQLPKSVQDRFLRDLAAGKIKVENWVPWWQHISTIDASDTVNKVKIEIISPEPEEEEETKEPPPEISTQIPSLSSLISKPPSPLLAFNIVNVLYSYAFSARVFNGELTENALQYMSQISDVLSGTNVYQNVKLALQAAIENSLKPGIAVTTQFSVSVVRDVASLFSTKKAVLAALSDVWRLVNDVKTDQRKKRQLELMQKKLEFFLAWANEQDDILFSNLQLMVLDDYLERKSQLSTK